jgi:hypothetical protein
MGCLPDCAFGDTPQDVSERTADEPNDTLSALYADSPTAAPGLTLAAD